MEKNSNNTKKNNSSYAYMGKSGESNLISEGKGAAESEYKSSIDVIAESSEVLIHRRMMS